MYRTKLKSAPPHYFLFNTISHTLHTTPSTPSTHRDYNTSQPAMRRRVLERLGEVCANVVCSTYRERDTRRQRGRKKCLFIAVLAALLATAVLTCIWLAFGYDHITPLIAAAGLTLLCTELSTLVYLLAGRQASNTAVTAFIAACTCALIALSLELSVLPAGTVWPMYILIADLVFLFQVHGVAKHVVLGVVFLGTAVSLFEGIYRAGLFDVVPGTSQARRREMFCGCEELPCALDVPSAAWAVVLQAVVLIGCPLISWHLQGQLAHEKLNLSMSVVAAQRIADALVRFDLAAAECGLEVEGTNIPEDLADALHSLLRNLKSYKPYLPQSCLEPFVSSKNLAEKDLPKEITDRTFNSVHSDKNLTISITEEIRIPAMVLPATPQFPAAYGKFQKRNVSVVVLNLRKSLAFTSNMSVFKTHHTTLMTTALAMCKTYKGIIDNFMGDHIYASFNASKYCPTHATSALNAALGVAKEFTDTDVLTKHPLSPPLSKSLPVTVSIGVSCGEAHVGDLGCAEVKRFSIVGKAPLFAAAVERVASAKGLAVLCDAFLYREVAVTHELRVLPLQVSMTKGDVEVSTLLYEAFTLLTPGQSGSSGDGLARSGAGEWMYEVCHSKWEAYNTAVEEYLWAAVDAEDRAVKILVEGGVPQDEGGHYSALVKHFRSGKPFDSLRVEY